jgi:hypothetical protein
MSSRREPPTTPREGDLAPKLVPSERELIVVTEPTARFRFTARGPAADTAAATSLAKTLSTMGATMKPLFEISETRAMHAAIEKLTTADASATEHTPDLSQYFRVEAPDEQLDSVAATLRELPVVQAAYVKPPTYPAAMTKTPASAPSVKAPPARARYTPGVTETGINDMLPREDDAAPVTPDFVSRQGYLAAAPGGIDAVFAATQPGGRGAGVRIIDIEGAWRFTHEDLLQNQGGAVAGSPSPDIGWRNHGTAVTGEFGGDLNAFGITGICPDANVRGISIFGGMGSAPAIRKAADLLNAGDIILIELHRPGPHATGIGQQGFIAVEWWPDDFDAIRYATSKGVLVVEAAGNGAENLDDPVYDTPSPGFPTSWSNPFRRGARDSGAILVGAGAPPPGTHGRDHGPDRSRLDFSNFGSSVDAQGWGREVTTTGYGDLQGGPNEDFWYTDQFSGTSSASPIVVGALGCVQGNRRARGLAALNPAGARNLLRTTGSPQQDAPTRPATQRIGSRPDLRRMIGVAVTLTVPLYRYWNPTNTDHFYTTNWSDLGSGRYGWGYEGIQCYVVPQQTPGTVPLYRYWNPGIGDHFYTTNYNELGAGRYGWSYEGIQCHVYTTPAVDRAPLYRYWNPTAGDHFYTTNWSDLGAGKYGWYFESVQCYVATQVRPPEAGAPDAGELGVTPDAELKTNGMGSQKLDPTVTGLGGGDVEGMTPPTFTSSGTSSGETPPTFATGLAAGVTGSTTDASSFTGVAGTEPLGAKQAARSAGRSITIRFNDET